MRHQGQISEWNDARGFGFVRPLEGEGRVFVHISAFPPGSRRPSPGEAVGYTLSQDERGRPRATHVNYVVDRPIAPGRRRQFAPERRRSRGLIFAAVTATAFLAAVAAAAAAGSLPWPVMWVYALASVVTYAAYAKDKRAAQAGRWRTGEGTLLLLGLIGGWPGGLIAQQHFRHKTKKVSFQVTYWLTVGLNCGGLILLRPYFEYGLG
ncbi:MAG TPA: DUF1294 domain-containing protein [Pyrinomonadaceae bacterium]|jgi:uncharacterized membrane protein YsdA (DUF1294 family)/cold shock CspA family protein